MKTPQAPDLRGFHVQRDEKLQQKSLPAGVPHSSYTSYSPDSMILPGRCGAQRLPMRLKRAGASTLLVVRGECFLHAAEAMAFLTVRKRGIGNDIVIVRTVALLNSPEVAFIPRFKRRWRIRVRLPILRIRAGEPFAGELRQEAGKARFLQSGVFYIVRLAVRFHKAYDRR